MIDRLGRPLGDRSPRRSPRTAGPTAEHDARLGSISPTLVRISQHPWSPSSDWAGLEQQQASCARTTKQQLQNQGMEIVVGWEPKDEVGTTQAVVHGPTEAFQQGQKLRSPPSTTDTVATNENRSGRREVERSHPRERGGCEGGGGEEEGSVRSWRFGLSLAGPDAISEMGARGACGCCLPWKRKPRAGRHGAGARINDDNDRGVKVFSQSQGPLWQSAAEREGLVRAL